MKNLKPILLVDDSLNDIELTREALRQSNLANVLDVARDGEQALDYLHRKGSFAERPPGYPLVVFLDLKMPKIDGLEVLRHMKGDARLRMIPVIMLTSSREETDRLRSYSLGVNAYVVKPVGFQKFVDAIKQLGMFWAVLNEPPPDPPS